MIDADEYVGPEWAEWYRLTPEERWEESLKLRELQRCRLP